MLHSLFAAEPHILAEPFAARLKIVLENHFALLRFYPEVARYLAAAREGQVTAPLPQEAITGFGKGRARQHAAGLHARSVARLARSGSAKRRKSNSNPRTSAAARRR